MGCLINSFWEGKMIEFIKIEKDNAEDSLDDWYEHYYLFQDNIKIEDVFVGKSGDDFYIESNSSDSSSKLSKLKTSDFSKASSLKFKPYVSLHETVSLIVEIDLPRADVIDKDQSELGVYIFIIPLQLHWKNSFTIAEYREVISSKLENHPDFDVESSFDPDSTPMRAVMNLFIGLPVILRFVEDFSNNPISEALRKYVELVKQKHDETFQLLSTKYEKDSLNTIFAFPIEIKTSCEQYLVYFAQFLQDLGINATSNLKEEAGKVLFSVTPTDDVEALDKIREALAVYLNLPSSPIVYDESFAAMRLHQQIDNLQHSQRMAEREIRSAERELRLAQTVIESQDKVIVQKDTLIEQQTKVIDKITSKSIMMDSLENKEELEEIFEGLKIGKSKFLMEQLGVHLNPATALKTVGKKILGKEDENKSILGLDEEKN
ncbi:MAG: hypothetical protein ACR2MG_07930 [Pyrinomonadaceae bacterium]